MRDAVDTTQRDLNRVEEQLAVFDEDEELLEEEEQQQRELSRQSRRTR